MIMSSENEIPGEMGYNVTILTLNDTCKAIGPQTRITGTFCQPPNFGLQSLNATASSSRLLTPNLPDIQHTLVQEGIFSGTGLFVGVRPCCLQTYLLLLLRLV